jgi:tetratricopeptide (TPR) repeat protein
MRIFSKLFLLFLILIPITVSAQSAGTYMDAVQLMREAKYEQAYTIFSRLLREDPTNYPVFDQTINVLVSLKRYEDAINITQRRLGQNYNDIILATRLAELHHLNGNAEESYRIWDLALRANQQSVNAYRFIADNMTQRRENAKAIEVYTLARQRFNNNTLFFSEITTNYMALGKREEAVSTLIDVLNFSPGNSAFVLRQIINFDDTEFAEIAIIELDERSRALTTSQDVVAAQKEVLIGLLMEQSFFRRALSTARSYESTANEGIWPVFTLAGRFRSIQEYQLAEEALDFYINSENHPLLPRALEDKAILYMTWAEYLKEYNLIYQTPPDTLINYALRSLNRLHSEFLGDSRRIETLSLKTELVLDNFSDVETASELVNEIRRIAFNNEHQIIADYLDGRINITQGYHSLARVSLTRSNREARTGELAEKTRYFLALNDFYAGDFEFSSIQMRALERLTTSYYANDALKLRIWMTEGMVKDSVTASLRAFSKSSYLFDVNKTNQALTELIPLLESRQTIPLIGDMIISISDEIRSQNPTLAYQLINKLGDKSPPAKRERILWEKARVMDLILSHQDSTITLPEELRPLATSLYTMDINSSETITHSTLLGWLNSTSISEANTIEAYENILLEYPTGFYAQLVRQRLESIKNSPL